MLCRLPSEWGISRLERCFDRSLSRSFQVVWMKHTWDRVLEGSTYLQSVLTHTRVKNTPNTKATHVSHVSCDSSQYGGIWWERVCRVMPWGALHSIGFLYVSWKPVGFKSMLIAKECHMSPDCEWWRREGLKCSLIKRCAAHVNQ